MLAERVGWSGSPSWFRKRVAELRPLFDLKDPADRLSYEPGDQAQSDLWFPARPIPVSARSSLILPVLVMVCSFSRFISAVMVPTRTTGDLLAGMWSLLSGSIGAVPHRLIWDNEAGIGRRNRLAEGVPGFVGTLATKIVQLKAYDPESKGVVERANGYLETSFLPGREFTGPADFNTQLEEWLVLANGRVIRSLGARPSELITADRAKMLALPPINPAVGFSQRVRLGRDYYVRVLGNDYSVDPAAIGRLIDVRADLGQVTASLQGQLITSHPRAWGSRGNITDPSHVLSAAKLRHAFQNPTPRPAEEADLNRDLADYDDAFGVDFTRRWAGRLMAAAAKGSEAASQIEYLARALKAPRISQEALRLGEQARDAGWTHEEYLAAVLAREVSAREGSGSEIRIRAAGFPGRKSIDEFIFDHQPGLKRELITHLGTGAFLTDAGNVVLLGPPGTGKTHLAIGLGIRAAQHGHRVLFATATEWVTRLQHAHQLGRLPVEIARLRRYGLIIVDEVGYIPFERDAANLFFQLVSSRYEHASLIMTSNLTFARWGEVFGDPTTAAAMIDRIVHHAEVITLKGASYRLKDKTITTLASERPENQAH